MQLLRLKTQNSMDVLANEVDIGLPLLMAILEQLTRQARDSREDLPASIFRTYMVTIDDIRPGLT
jgi:uncharacterized protein